MNYSRGAEWRVWNMGNRYWDLNGRRPSYPRPHIPYLPPFPRLPLQIPAPTAAFAAVGRPDYTAAMGLIPRSFIDDLLARTDIVDVIDSHVPLRKAGKDFQALCPFHDEKTPSFTVSREKQFFHCFGCQASGTVITFLMEYRNLGFLDAVEELAARAGLEVPKEGGVRQGADQSTELYELMEMAVAWYRSQLREHPEAQRAIDYLKGRGITGETAARFELGFAPPGWDNLLGRMGKSEASMERLLRTGLIVRREGGDGAYDRFRNRIMFPIRDQRGRAIGFGGRVLNDETPKYLNSPETPIFHKGRELYGLHLLRGGIGEILVVEGYMDVLALHQFGITSAVATLGTAATRDHMERLFRAASIVDFCFDGDEAGRRAAWRALENCLPLLRDGRQVHFIFLPQGEDPDTFVRRHGSEAFAGETNRMPLSDYLVETIRSGLDLESREGRAALVERARPLLRQLPDGALRRLLIQDLAGLAGTRMETLEPLLQPDAESRTATRRPRANFRPPDRSNRSLVGRIVRLLLVRPALAELVEEPAGLREAGLPGVDFLAELVEFILSRPEIRCAGILEHWRDSPLEARLKELAADAEMLESADVDLEAEFLDALEGLGRQKRKQQLRELTKVTRVGDLSEAERDLLRNLGSAAGTGREK
jgi:DNA primase